MRLLALAFLVLATACHPRVAEKKDLRLLLVLSRHGIRSPLAHDPPMSAYTLRPEGWPRWPPPADRPGFLSPRGKARAVWQGVWYRALLAREGTLPATGCAAPDAAAFYADVDERTRATAAGLIEGFFRGAMPAGCGVVARTAATKVDPLFHPLAAHVCPLDHAAARREIQAAIGGGLDEAVRRAPDLLAWAQLVTACCQPAACGGTTPCKLASIPARLEAPADKDGLKLRGPISVASNIAESLQMEWAEGMPEVGWGTVDEPRLLALMRLHTLKYELIDRTPTLARARASNLALHLLRTLEQAAAGRPVAGALGPPGSRFIAVVGHDSNLVSLAALLGLHWKLDGYVADDPPATSALVFELRTGRSSGRAFVRLSFVSQSLAQMREDQPLSLAHPPLRATLTLPGCAADCPLATFRRIVSAAADARCATP